jgi:FkbM family methyltransferase
LDLYACGTFPDRLGWTAVAAISILPIPENAIGAEVMRRIVSLLPEGLAIWLRGACHRLRARSQPTPTLALDVFDGFHIAYRKGSSDEDALRHSFGRDIFFTGVPEYIPGPHDTIIDVGAHIGTFSLLAASRVPFGHVYAIEACQESFNLLCINAALNQMTHIDASHLALSDQSATCMLHYDSGNWGHTIVRPILGRGESVTSESLPRFLASKGIARCHFLKLNCEGAEFRILLNTPPDILQRFMIILVLYHCDICPEYSEQHLLAHFQASGFTTTVRNRTTSRGWIVAVNPGFAGYPQTAPGSESGQGVQGPHCSPEVTQ